MRLTRPCGVAHEATATDLTVNFDDSFIAESFFAVAWPRRQRAPHWDFRS